MLVCMWWLACASTSFESIRLEGGSLAQQAEAARAVHDFATWTGKEGVGVEEIALLKQVWVQRSGESKQVRGHYQGGRIELDASDPDLYKTTIHELCHALDTQEILSDALSPELLPASPLYPTERLRRREAFARACTEGALLEEPFAIQLSIDAQCGRELISPLARMIQERVFTARPVPLLPVLSERASLTAEPLPVSVNDKLLGVSGALEGPLLLVEQDGVLFPDAAVGKSLSDALGLYHFDLESHQLERLALPDGVFTGEATLGAGELKLRSFSGEWEQWPLSMGDASTWEEPAPDFRWIQNEHGAVLILNGEEGPALPANGCEPETAPEDTLWVESAGYSLGVWADSGGLMIGKLTLEPAG
jgi:hypothetical protein